MQEQRQQQQSPSPTPTQQQQSSGSGSLRRMMRVNSPKMCTPIEEKLEQNLKVSDYRTLLLSLSLARALSIFLSLGLSLTCALRARAFLRLEQLVSVCEGKGGRCRRAMRNTAPGMLKLEVNGRVCIVVTRLERKDQRRGWIIIIFFYCREMIFLFHISACCL